MCIIMLTLIIDQPLKLILMIIMNACVHHSISCDLIHTMLVTILCLPACACQYTLLFERKVTPKGLMCIIMLPQIIDQPQIMYPIVIKNVYVDYSIYCDSIHIMSVPIFTEFKGLANLQFHYILLYNIIRILLLYSFQLMGSFCFCIKILYFIKNEALDNK